jgi:Ca2+/Na+ antiporter
MEIIGALIFSVFVALYIFVIKAIFTHKKTKVIAGSAVVILCSLLCYLTIVNPNPIEAPISFFIIALLAFYFFVMPAVFKESEDSINAKIRKKVSEIINQIF